MMCRRKLINKDKFFTKGEFLMSATTISFFTGKGGTGKTSSAININVSFRNRGIKILNIDTDTQRNCYNIIAPDFVNYEPNLCNVMNREVSIRQAIQKTSDYHIIPSSNDQNRLNDSITDIKILQELLCEIKNDYDAVFIDNSPAFTKLTYCSIFASDYVLSPCQVSNECLDAVSDLMALVNSAEFKNLNPNFKGVGVFFSQYNLRPKRQNILNRHIVDDFKRLSKILGFKLFSTSIPKNSDIAHASANHQNIFQYKIKSPATEAYNQLTEEILDFINLGGE